MRLRGVLARSGALVGVLVLGDVAAYLSPSPDADIGLGLLVFAAVAVVAGALGMLDGRRGTLPSLAPGWLAVAGLVGVAGAAKISLAGWLGGSGLYGSVLLSDLRGVAPFLAALVAIPALLGVAAGGTARRATHG